jgi:hypothetical protein
VILVILPYIGFRVPTCASSQHGSAQRERKGPEAGSWRTAEAALGRSAQSQRPQVVELRMQDAERRFLAA